MGMVRVGQFARSCRSLPLRGRNVGLVGSTICCSCWCLVHRPRDDCLLYGTHHEHIHLYVLPLSPNRSTPQLTVCRWYGLGWCRCWNQRSGYFPSSCLIPQTLPQRNANSEILYSSQLWPQHLNLHQLQSEANTWLC